MQRLTPNETSDTRAYWQHRLEHRWGLETVGFLGLGEGYNRALYRVKAAVFRRAVIDLGIDLHRARILDIGSGTGFVVEQWLAMGATVVSGSDIAAFAVTQLRELFPQLQFHQLNIGSPLTDELAPASFDSISALDVLYHIVDDDAYGLALRNIGTLLKPGGVLLLADNFLHGPTQRCNHQVSHSLEAIENWMAQAGLRIERRTPQYVLMNAPIDSSSRLLHGWWRRLRRHLVRSARRGLWLGRALTPLELAVTRIVREGPSTELAVCRKIFQA